MIEIRIDQIFEDIVETIREPLLVLNQDLNVLTANRSFYKFFKVNPEETVGQLIYDLGNKQWNIPRLRELLETILPEKTSFDDYEVEHDFATIGRRTMLLNARQIIRGTGQERIILLAIEDITERNQVEENLKEAITIINRSPAVTFTWRNETGWPVEFVSENVTKLFGYTSEEWTSGKVSYIDIIYPDDLERVAGEVARSSKENGIEEFAHEPYRIIANDGSVHWVHDWTFITRNEKGSITHYKGILQDITERKQAEEALQDSEARLNEAQAVAHIGNWSQDLRTTEALWSEENYRIFGLSHEALLLQETFEKTIHPEDREFVNKSQEDAIKRKQPFDIEFRIILPGGKERIVRSIAKTDYDNEGQPIRFFGTNQDITERKQVEEELAKYREHLEELVEERTKELTEKVTELEIWYDATINRELRMEELRVEMKKLKAQINTDKNTD